VEIARQLRLRGIDAVTVQDLGLSGEQDINHLTNATEQSRVLCTHDSDFLELAALGVGHAGIAFGQQRIHYIGEWVNWLTLMHAIYSPEEMQNRIEFL
jgi:uncharacterized protein with PIN domain